MDRIFEARKRERNAEDKASFREMEKHTRCALLPSPDILDTAALEGKDVTNTLGDYAAVLKWVTKRGLLNTGHYKEPQKAVVELVGQKKKNFKRKVWSTGYLCL